MKLWDLRMVMSREKFNRMEPDSRGHRTGFDYRWGPYDDNDWFQDKNDNSIVTFRGHRVLKTLIRCHFSPPGSTNSRYVYSGSEDGKVHVWNMDGTVAGKIDVQKATKNSRPPYSRDVDYHSRWKTIVRDASWHPNAPMIVGKHIFPNTPTIICPYANSHKPLPGMVTAITREHVPSTPGTTEARKTKPSRKWATESTHS